MVVLLKLTIAGSNSGPFNLYSNIDGYTSAFKSNVSKADLTSPLGYSIAVPYNTTIVKIKSTNACTNSIDITISPKNCSFIVNATETTIIVPPTVPTVTIGTQTWMTKNLDVSTYRDGTPILQASTSDSWSTGSFPATYGSRNKVGSWCYYNNTVSNGTNYGKLYNWWAMKGIYDAASLADPGLRKQIAPLGYHVPTEAEWKVLELFVGGNALRATGTIEAGTGLWKASTQIATNATGFTGLPGGNRYAQDNTFANIGDRAWYWASTDGTLGYNSFWGDGVVYVLGGNSLQSLNYYSKNSGFSIRLIKD